MSFPKKIEDKIVDRADLNSFIHKWKSNDEVIVFTNGCFDIIHLGHIDYLSKASDLGTKLIVAINSDESVSRLKGANRPLQDEKSRLHIMAAFEFVDAVVMFSEDTPYDIISECKPDVLVKGADYEISEIVGADIVLENGGKVERLHYLEGYSTSLIEKRMKGC